MIVNPVLYSGKKLPELDNPGTAADLLAGKQLVDQYGNPLTGTMPKVSQAVPAVSIDANGLITATAVQEAGCVNAGTKSAAKQLTKRGSGDLSASGASIIVPAGYYPSQVSKSVATAAHPKPTLSRSGGTVTAKHVQGAGYTSGGTTTETLTIPTQAGKTVTPTTYAQTAVASGRLTTGAVNVAGDANLVAGNIKSGVSIFGVAGSLQSENFYYTALNLSNGARNEIKISVPFKPRAVILYSNLDQKDTIANMYGTTSVKIIYFHFCLGVTIPWPYSNARKFSAIRTLIQGQWYENSYTHSSNMELVTEFSDTMVSIRPNFDDVVWTSDMYAFVF